MATVYRYVDPSGDGGDGTTWAEAFNEAQFETDLEANSTAGYVYYIRGGTLTIADSSWDMSGAGRDGTAVEPVTFIGVNAACSNTGASVTYSDWATGDNRPTIACGAYTITFADYVKVFNIKFTSSAAANHITTAIANVFYNCDFYSTRDGNQNMVYGRVGGVYISCKFWGDANAKDHIVGIDFTSNLIFGCYFVGLKSGGGGSGVSSFLFNTFYNCTTGIDVSTRPQVVSLNNSFQACTTAVSGSTGYGTFINNAIAGDSTDGFKWTTQSDMNFFMKNCGKESADAGMVDDMWDLVATTMPHCDFTWVAAGANDADPLFHGAGEMHLEAGSPALNNALSATLGT